MITDKLKSYSAAHREMTPSVPYETSRWSNNRAEVSHEAIRHRERQLRRFKSPGHAQRFVSSRGVIGNLFRVGRQKVRAATYRLLRTRSFKVWQQVTCVC